MPVQQRIFVVGVIAAIVVGLILAGCSPHIALTMTSGIVLIASQVWTPESRDVRRGQLRKNKGAGDQSDHSG
ncbi:hypothetical protein R6V09_00525 [Streptomyces sp. W16]|uniref:hypothetical protein n=1 Tax=Streptomyces sp. W16 TaxID=3076631 RepID=UPI00295BFE88|nr:hypothetical protein [Streptomyces sp. W16]MDV9168628.1 hypothetical protein [Streptomyces sp. W16]